eukprot:3339664-Amphidinium_carterae.2
MTQMQQLLAEGMGQQRQAASEMRSVKMSKGNSAMGTHATCVSVSKKGNLCFWNSAWLILQDAAGPD